MSVYVADIPSLLQLLGQLAPLISTNLLMAQLMAKREQRKKEWKRQKKGKKKTVSATG